ncbi:MAG TPA: ABC transporter ATP-binding protein [Gammaproteobacteria bacterium]|nr:ABC transporter ATP-binding protein [Gammaproteobacteria bacterium]
MHVLENVTFRVPQREFVAVVGPSGCGKTTLLKLIAGLIEPTSGEVSHDGDASTNGRGVRSALVFQEDALFPWMNVRDNVAFGMQASGLGKKQSRERASELISRFGLEGFAEYYPRHLSMGMQQRVGIARAFLADPEILLMDEPFASLDAQTKLILQEDLLTIWRQDQKIIVYVTHDIEEAIRLSDRVLVMAGRPASIQEEISIPLGRPRQPADCDRPGISELKWHIWKMLKQEARESLTALR